MRKYTGNAAYILCIIFFTIVIAFISCKKEPIDDAASVVMSYLTTTDEKQLLNFLNSASRTRVENIKKSYGTVYPFIWVHHDKDAKWDVVKINKTQESAEVVLQCIAHKKQNAIGLEVTHKLVKEDGKWKIDITDELPSH